LRNTSIKEGISVLLFSRGNILGTVAKLIRCKMWSYFRDRCPQQTYLQNKFTNSSSQTHSQSYSRNRSVNIANTKVVDTTYQIAYFTLQVPNKVEYVYTDLCSKFNARSSFYYYYFFFFRSYKLFSGGFPTHFCRHRSPC